MTNLQEYLNQKYPTPQEKEKVTKLCATEINEDLKNQGITELLTGGELDLREFVNIEEIIIDQQYLATPISKIDTEGLTHLKEITWPNFTPETEEDKKLWTELGIAAETGENTSKKQVIKEVKRLSELFVATKLTNQKINLNFSTNHALKDQLKDGKKGLTEINNGDFDIYLNLEQKDSLGNFAIDLIFWTFAQELTHTLITERFSPNFWQRFLFDTDPIIKWVDEEVRGKYSGLKLSLANPSTFSHSLLSINEVLKINLFNANLPAEIISEQVIITSELIDQTWTEICQELINLTNIELNKGMEQEKLTQLLTLEINRVNSAEQYNATEYIFKITYHQENPLKEQIKQLFLNTPLKLEIEQLKQKQSQLPTPENFEKLTKQKVELENCLRDFTDEYHYQELLKKINEIK